MAFAIMKFYFHFDFMMYCLLFGLWVYTYIWTILYFWYLYKAVGWSLFPPIYRSTIYAYRSLHIPFHNLPIILLVAFFPFPFSKYSLLCISFWFIWLYLYMSVRYSLLPFRYTNINTHRFWVVCWYWNEWLFLLFIYCDSVDIYEGICMIFFFWKEIVLFQGCVRYTLFFE